MATPAPKTVDEESGLIDNDESDTGRCSPGKAFLGIILTIVSCFLTLIFFVVWVVLVPFKFCCTCDCLTSVTEWIVEDGFRMPITVASWALS